MLLCDGDGISFDTISLINCKYTNSSLKNKPFSLNISLKMF